MPAQAGHYDAFLGGWSLLCDRYRHELDTRPLVMWVGPTYRDAQRTARLADEQLITRWQVNGTDGAHAYYPAPEHIVFVDEHDLLAGSLRGWMVPPRPAATPAPATVPSSKWTSSLRRSAPVLTGAD